MASALVDAFRSELPCSDAEARTLAELARGRVPHLAGSPEDTEEDVVLRLRDPRLFGEFVESVGGDARVTTATRVLLLEHVFDLLPLPRTEGEVIAVETRAPRHLLSFAAALVPAGGLSVLHVMHLVYAVFLDRSLVSAVPRPIRSAVLHAIVTEGGSGEGVRVLYAALHLASVAGSEAAGELQRILGDPVVPIAVRRSLAALAAAEDGGQGPLMRMAQREGLIPEAIEDAPGPSALASIPRLPEGLRPAGRRFLEQADAK